jgi:hypothetical protein
MRFSDAPTTVFDKFLLSTRPGRSYVRLTKDLTSKESRQMTAIDMLGLSLPIDLPSLGVMATAVAGLILAFPAVALILHGTAWHGR